MLESMLCPIAVILTSHFRQLLSKLSDQCIDILSIVLVLPPAPAALVLAGRALATLSALSAAAFLRIAVLAPPGGDEGRAVLEPADGGALTGELVRGED